MAWSCRLPGWIPGPHASRLTATCAALERLRPDVINIHNIHAGSLMGWSTNLIRISAEFAPVVCTLHDMWSFTGRCRLQLRLPDVRDRLRCELSDAARVSAARSVANPRGLGREATALSAIARPCRGVAVGRLADEALRGCWAGHRVEVIANVLPLNIFRPRPRSEARRALGLDCTGPVILVSAQLLTERRKGVLAV